jgi:hypothetical protein
VNSLTEDSSEKNEKMSIISEDGTFEASLLKQKHS